MKKLLTILAIILIASVGLFAKTGKVILSTSVASESVELSLKNSSGVEIADAGEDTVVVDITNDGTTGDYTIDARYNKRNDLTLKVNIEPGEFINNDENGNDSGITPSVIGQGNISFPYSVGLDNGNHLNNPKTLCTFYFSWNGESDLDAGDYTSTNIINYYVE
ncbi:MAG: hypothetical protein ACPKM0_04015 [Pleomorphochaeta sp.]